MDPVTRRKCLRTEGGGVIQDKMVFDCLSLSENGCHEMLYPTGAHLMVLHSKKDVLET